MIKRILTLTLSIVLLAGMPVMAHGETDADMVEQGLQSIDISVSGSVLHVTGAAGKELFIYNVTGVRVKSFRVDSNDKRYDLNLQKGCYIVKVGKVVRKIYIR